MKKSLVIANMMFASINVFGMNSYNESNREGIMQQEFTELMKEVENNNLAKVKKIVGRHEDISAVCDLLTATKNKRKMSTKQIDQYRKNIFQNSYIKELVNLSNDKYKATLLIIASEKGYFEIMKYLVDHGADINKETNYGENSLWLFVSSNGKTPLLGASAEGHTEIVKYLIDHGADVNKSDEKGWTPLRKASARGHTEIVKYLVDHEADVNKADESGYTPLLIASEEGHTEIVKYLVDHGADVNKAFEGDEMGWRWKGWTPLFGASKKGHRVIVEYLVAHGADVNKADMSRETPLFKASEYGHEEIVKYLVKHGADINKKGSRPAS